VDEDDNGIPDEVDDFVADSPDLVTCSNFGPLPAGGSGLYAIDDKFEVGMPIQVVMFSTPVKLFDGVVPANRSVTLVIPANAAAGKHKFIQFGVDSEGTTRVGGCVADVKGMATSTTAAPGATSTTAAGTTGGGAAQVKGSTQSAGSNSSGNGTTMARTGQEAAQVLILASGLCLFGALLMVILRRRSDRQSPPA
jgi:hypothetical protein